MTTTHRGVQRTHRAGPGARRAPRPPGRWRGLLVVLGVVAAVGIVVGSVYRIVAPVLSAPQVTGDVAPSSPSSSSSASTSASPSASAVPSPTPSPSSRLSAAPAREVGTMTERPRSLRLPDGTVVPVRAVNVSQGRLDVPDDIRDAGWWRGGARIGDPFGAMLLAAHVDSVTQGLGPYAQLLTARPGQRVVVASTRLTQTFVLRSRQVVPRDRLAQQRTVFSPAGDPRLVLVTCAGPYDRDRGGYQNLAVLTAVPTAPPAQR